MKNEDIENDTSNQKETIKIENINISKRISNSFHIKRNFESLLLNKKGNPKPLKGRIYRNSLGNIFQINENTEINQKIKEEKNNTLNIFYNIRKQILRKIKKPYLNPYMENKNNFNFLQNNNNYSYKYLPYKISSSDRTTFYDYYQICYLLNKNIKNYRLLSRLNDYLLLYDNQEYFMKFFNTDEQKIVMNYLLFIVYDKNIEVKLSKNSKKKVSERNIIDSFQNLKKYIYYQKNKNSDSKEENKMQEIDEKNNYFQMMNIKPVLKTNIKHIFIFDISKRLVPYFTPNLFPNLFFHSFYFKLYLNLRKNKLIKNIESLINEEQKEVEITSSKNPNFNDENKNYFEEIKQKIKENIKENIYNLNIEENNKGDITNISDNKKMNINYNNNDENRDIEKLLYKFNTITQTKRTKEKKMLLKNEKMKYKQIKKWNNFLIKKREYNTIKNEENDNSLLENKNNIMLYNKRFFLKTAKKKTKAIFATSLNGTSFFSKNKTSQKSTNYNPNSIIKEKNKKINNNKIKTNNIIKISNSEIQDKSNNSILILKSFSNKNSKNLKTAKNRAISIHYPVNQKFIKKNIFKINKSQIYNLHGFENIYKGFKRKGILPKPKKNYSTYIHKAFDSMAGFDFVNYVENKKNNNKIEYEENKILNEYNTKKLEKSIKQMINNIKQFHTNNFYWKKMVNSPNFYGH